MGNKNIILSMHNKDLGEPHNMSMYIHNPNCKTSVVNNTYGLIWLLCHVLVKSISSTVMCLKVNI